MKKRILLVDDDAMTLRILKKYLEGQYDIVLETAGNRLAEKPENYDVDLILLDIEMPVMNGIQVFNKYLENNGKNVPVMFLSSTANPEIDSSVYSKGAVGYVVKNAPRSEILKRIEGIFLREDESGKAGKILIIDGNREYLKRRTAILKDKGYPVLCATSISGAVEMLRIASADCLLVSTDEFGINPDEVAAKIGSVIDLSSVHVCIIDDNYNEDDLVEKVGSIFVSK